MEGIKKFKPSMKSIISISKFEFKLLRKLIIFQSLTKSRSNSGNRCKQTGDHLEKSKTGKKQGKKNSLSSILALSNLAPVQFCPTLPYTVIVVLQRVFSSKDSSSACPLNFIGYQFLSDSLFSQAYHVFPPHLFLSRKHTKLLFV